MEGVYSRAWHMGKGRGFRTCKGGTGKIWRKDECGGEKAREVRNGREKEF